LYKVVLEVISTLHGNAYTCIHTSAYSHTPTHTHYHTHVQGEGDSHVHAASARACFTHSASASIRARASEHFFFGLAGTDARSAAGEVLVQEHFSSHRNIGAGALGVEARVLGGAARRGEVANRICNNVGRSYRIHRSRFATPKLIRACHFQM